MDEKLVKELFEDLMIEFDEMDFVPRALCKDPEEYAKAWKSQVVQLFNELIKKD